MSTQLRENYRQYYSLLLALRNKTQVIRIKSMSIPEGGILDPSVYKDEDYRAGKVRR
jgi:hypothetical protein